MAAPTLSSLPPAHQRLIRALIKAARAAKTNS